MSPKEALIRKTEVIHDMETQVSQKNLKCLINLIHPHLISLFLDSLFVTVILGIDKKLCSMH